MPKQRNFLKLVGSTMKGAGETLENWGYVRASKKKTKKMIDELIDKVAKKNFIKQYGRIAYNKAMEPGSLFNFWQHRYKKTKKKIAERYKHLR